MFSLCIPASAAEEEADLTVLGIFPDISEPQIGDDVVFTVEYSNFGKLSNESFVIFLFVDETLEKEMEVSPPAPGEEESADFLFHIGEDMEPGEHSVIAVIDAYGQVSETDESNNDFTGNFFVSEDEKPDLFIDEIVWTPESPNTGDEVTFSIMYGNQGTRIAGNDFDIGLYVDDLPITYEWVYDLQPGESDVIECTWTVDPDFLEGEHTVAARIDTGYVEMDNELGDSGVVEEIDEKNNKLTRTFLVSKELPDLLIRDISWDPAIPKADDEVVFSVTCANQGIRSAEGDFYICLYVDDFLVGSELLADLQPGESAVCEFFWTVNQEVPEGEHEVAAYIDMEDRGGYSAHVEEFDETNNEFTNTLQVSEEEPESDEEPEDEEGSESDGEPEGEEGSESDGEPEGEEGSESDGEPEGEEGSESDGEPGGEPGSGGEPGNEEEPEGNGEPEGETEGEEEPEDEVEPENNEEPESEGSSESGENSGKGGEPDLVIEELTWDPASPKTEDEVTFSVKYGNRGSLSSGKDFYICLYLDDSRLGYEKVPALQAGESAIYECSWKPDRDTEGGDHRVAAYIDMKDKDGYSEYVEEKNEANNDFSRTVKVEKIRSFGELDISVVDDSSGEPVEGVEVYLDNTFIGSTDQEGFFRSEAAQGETHIINVLHPDYFESMKEVEMGYAEITEVKMEIICAKVPLTLNVKNSFGQPVSNAEVFIEDNLTGSTDLEGVLEVRLLQESDVLVRVEKETYYPAEGHVHVGNRGDSYTLTLKQEDPRAPTIEVSGISEIGDGDSILEDGEELEMDFFVRDESGIKTVRVKIDGTLIDTFYEEGAYKSAMGPLSAGKHLIEIEASDLDENEHKNLKEIPLEVSDKGPSVAFQCTKKEIDVGETAVFDLGVMNPLGGKTMNVQLVVRPPSGVSVSGSYFATSAGGMYQAEYTLEPGSDVRTISLEMIGNEEGKHDVEADVFYSFEEGKSYSRHDTLSLDVKSSDSPFSAEGSQESVEGFAFEYILNSVEGFTSESVKSVISEAPASMGLVFIFSVLLLLIVSRRKK